MLYVENLISLKSYQVSSQVFYLLMPSEMLFGKQQDFGKEFKNNNINNKNIQKWYVMKWQVTNFSATRNRSST